MKLVLVDPHETQAMRQHLRRWMPPSAGAEMICSAITMDFDLEVRAAMDERGIAGAVSYTTYRDRVHVFSLGSIVKGAGSFLLASVEGIARALSLPVTVAATKSSESFYAQRGYKKIRGQKSSSIVRMKLK